MSFRNTASPYWVLPQLKDGPFVLWLFLWNERLWSYMFLKKLRDRFRSEYLLDTHLQFNSFDWDFGVVVTKTADQSPGIVTRRFSKPFVDAS